MQTCWKSKLYCMQPEFRLTEWHASFTQCLPTHVAPFPVPSPGISSVQQQTQHHAVYEVYYTRSVVGDLHKERFIIISGPHNIRIVIIILIMRAGEGSGQKSSKLPSTRVLSLSRHLHSCLILVFLPDNTLQIVKVHFWTYHQKMAELSVCSFLFQEIFSNNVRQK